MRYLVIISDKGIASPKEKMGQAFQESAWGALENVMSEYAIFVLLLSGLNQREQLREFACRIHRCGKAAAILQSNPVEGAEEVRNATRILVVRIKSDRDGANGASAIVSAAAALAVGRVFLGFVVKNLRLFRRLREGCKPDRKVRITEIPQP